MIKMINLLIDMNPNVNHKNINLIYLFQYYTLPRVESTVPKLILFQ